MGTLSRTVFSALRIGYLVVPKSLVNVFTAAKWLSDRHTATLEQQTLADFIVEGAYERHLRHLRRRNAARRKVLLEVVHKHLGDRVEVTGDGAGTHVVLWPYKQHSEKTLIQRAAAVGVSVYGTSQYFLGEPTRVGLIFGYARVRESEIRLGIARIADLL
jgi:GntR family transcriptional regulator/MocR family aminotransferase